MKKLGIVSIVLGVIGAVIAAIAYYVFEDDYDEMRRRYLGYGTSNAQISKSFFRVHRNIGSGYYPYNSGKCFRVKERVGKEN